MLCEACLHQRLLQRCSQALGDEDHPLHPPLQRMFERLASQALQPMALRYGTELMMVLQCKMGCCVHNIEMLPHVHEQGAASRPVGEGRLLREE